MVVVASSEMMVLSRRMCRCGPATVEGVKPVMVMVIVQVAFAAINIFYKLAVVDGMNLNILVAYRFIFAAAFIGPVAFFVERKSRPKLTRIVLGQAFLSGLFGGSLLQNLYLQSLALTSATFASAMANLVPALTFILALLFRMERLSLGRISGKVKVVGTLLGIGGAMVLTFFKGFEIELWSTNINLINNPHHRHYSTAAERTANKATSSGPHDQNLIIGALLSLASSLSYSCWLILQAKMCESYPSYYSSTALMSLMGSIQATVYALIVDHNWNHWKLGWNIRLWSAAYVGIIGSGVTLTLIAWCVRMRGPLFVSIFNPLMLVLVAIAGSLILDEKLYLGSVLGSVFIISGLYMVLWGKTKEAEIIPLQPVLTSADDHERESLEINGANFVNVSRDERPGRNNKDRDIRKVVGDVEAAPSNGGTVLSIESNLGSEPQGGGVHHDKE